jgi:hypothetical protein
MSIAGKYRKSLDEKWCLRFKTRHPDGDSYDGVVTQIKRDFIVLREAIDFDFDGIIILPKKFIKGYRDGRYEQCYNEILRENGILRKTYSPKWLIACETLPEVMEELRKRDIWPGVEIIFNGDSETAFYLGPVTSATDDYFYLKSYDAAGKWEKEYKLAYDEIFMIELDSSYCNRFNTHMRKRKDS